MNYKQLFFLVEGDDDERFFQRIIKPKFEQKHYTVIAWKYAQVNNMKVESFIKSIKAMGADYIYVADINRALCITAKKQKIKDRVRNIDEDRIIVVIKEIESWYLAGLDETSSKKLGVGPFSTTDSITKERFNDLIPKKFRSKIDFVLEILQHFSIEIANQKNISFRHFFEKQWGSDQCERG